ncbi:Xaa-Pro peptidase family protein [Caballeronia sp. AZ7_KS35]|uniref:M24 family metallopeptidase n=1 Tax=Caballeronia sp. AZ7_KS35 TaxID=2921762 RepID=UPI002028C49A|nr:Xaa-Pro peptidase family protein [Caballeronia sp. AZ7_KS35]
MNFPKQEFDERVARVRAGMKSRGMDMLLLYGQEAINWTSGFYTPAHFAYAAFGLPLEGEPFLVIRYIEEKAARVTTWVEDIRTYWDHEDPVEATKRAVESRSLGTARIALDKQAWYLTADRYDRLKAALPSAIFVDESRMIDELRIIKSPLELDTMRKSARIVEAALQGAIEATKEGVTERDVAAAMAFARLKAGSDLPVDGVLTTGERTLEGHGPWTDRVLRRGDALHYEFHGIKNHYWTRILRTGVLGAEPTDDQWHTADTILKSQDIGLSMMKAGARSLDIDAAMRAPMLEAGLKQRASYTNRLGYGMGLNFRPSPGEFIREFTPSCDFILEEGMVFHMIMAANGLGYSDTVAVTKDGIEFLTKFPREFVVLK